MITPEELRIGNYVVMHGVLHRVDLDLLTVLWHNEIHIEGLPLTPEVLEKAGFTNRWEDSWETTFIEIDKSKYGGYVLLNGEERSHWAFRYEYLHQLQNVHFALTGEELEIQL